MADRSVSELSQSEAQSLAGEAPSFHTIPASANLISLTTKCGLLVLVVLTAILVGSLFIYTRSTDSLLPNALHHLTVYHRLWTQVIVTALASALAFAQTYQVCTVITFTLNQSCGQRAYNVTTLSFWIAFSKRRLDWSQHWTRTLALLGWLIITISLTTVWSGALTPVPSVRTTTSTALRQARYSNGSADFWVGTYASCVECWGSVSTTQIDHTSRGVFTYTPVFGSSDPLIYRLNF